MTASDASGNSTSCAFPVTVVDTTPPQISLTVAPTVLWPPNHRMVPERAAWQVTDVCDPAAGAVLASATSSEPDDAPDAGDGNTSGDIQGTLDGTAANAPQLRAERSADGPGRTYTLRYQARDASGNTTSALGVVTVPHDLGTGPEPLLMNLEPDGTSGMAHLYWNEVPRPGDGALRNAVAGTCACTRLGCTGDELQGGEHGGCPGDGEGVLLSRAVLGRAGSERLGDGDGAVAGGADSLRSRVSGRGGQFSRTTVSEAQVESASLHILMTSFGPAGGARSRRPGGRKWPA